MDDRFHKGYFAKEEIKKYLQYIPQNQERHQAHVFVTSRDKTVYNSTLYVTVDENGTIIIEGDIAYGNYLDSTIILKDNGVRFVQGILWIHTKDRWGNPISVEITPLIDR